MKVYNFENVSSDLMQAICSTILGQNPTKLTKGLIIVNRFECSYNQNSNKIIR